MKKQILFSIPFWCLACFAFQSFVNAGAFAAALAYQVEANGTVIIFDGPHNVAFLQPEMFTEGWSYHAFKEDLEGPGGVTGRADLGSGETVIVKTAVEALPQGLRVHYTLVPKETVRALQIRVPVYLNYPQWRETPYQLGAEKGKVPTDRVSGWGLIVQADGRPLSLGPSPALGGLQVQLDPGAAHLCLADNRQWTPNLLAMVLGNEPSDKPWAWIAGQEKHIDLTLTFNRQVSAVPTPTPQESYGMDSQNSLLVPANDPDIQYSGRFDFSNPLAPRFDWPAVSISAVFQGTAIGILLDDGNNDYDALIDGKLKQVIVTDGATQYTVGGLKAGTHKLLLARRTEASFGIAAFKGFVLQKGMSLLKPPSPPSRRIEFVGDSLACAAEVEDPDTSCEPTHFRPTENAYLAFGPLAARALNADYRVSSYSGTGILAKFGEANLAMPGYYPRVLAGRETPVMDPRQWVPDAVVIELGGNDFFSGGTPPSKNEFEDAYKKFIAVLRADYPAARIFCFTFRNSRPASGYIQDVAAREKNAGDGNVGLLEADYPRAHLTGCYKHFDLVGQQQVGDELAKAMGKAMGWDEEKSR